jgi:general secretion pathway protein L
VLHRPAAALCLLLAAGALVVPFVRQAVTLSRLDAQVAAGRQAVLEAEKLRAEIDRQSQSGALIDSERRKAGRPLALLAAVTRALPDDSYLTELLQQQRKITINGRSAGAARLIGALAADDALKNPAFAAPVTRIESARAEVFSIAAEVGP